MPTATDTQVLKLKNVRLSYAQLFSAKAMQNPDGSMGKPKFSATFLLNKKEHAATIAQLEKLIERTALEEFGKKVPLKHVCLRDGNEKPETDGYGDETMFIPTTSQTRPAVVDGKLTPIAEEDGKIYSGCYVNATIRLFAYEFKNQQGKVMSRGVSANLRAIQFLKDGDAFGAAPVNPEDEFEEVTSDSVENY